MRSSGVPGFSFNFNFCFASIFNKVGGSRGPLKHMEPKLQGFKIKLDTWLLNLSWRAICHFNRSSQTKNCTHGSWRVYLELPFRLRGSCV